MIRSLLCLVAMTIQRGSIFFSELYSPSQKSLSLVWFDSKVAHVPSVHYLSILCGISQEWLYPWIEYLSKTQMISLTTALLVTQALKNFSSLCCTLGDIGGQISRWRSPAQGATVYEKFIRSILQGKNSRSGLNWLCVAMSCWRHDFMSADFYLEWKPKIYDRIH
jgi:hypothetical protein